MEHLDRGHLARFSVVPLVLGRRSGLTDHEVEKETEEPLLLDSSKDDPRERHVIEDAILHCTLAHRDLLCLALAK